MNDTSPTQRGRSPVFWSQIWRCWFSSQLLHSWLKRFSKSWKLCPDEGSRTWSSAKSRGPILRPPKRVRTLAELAPPTNSDHKGSEQNWWDKKEPIKTNRNDSPSPTCGSLDPPPPSGAHSQRGKSILGLLPQHELINCVRGQWSPGPCELGKAGTLMLSSSAQKVTFDMEYHQCELYLPLIYLKVIFHLFLFSICFYEISHF